jgi:hypothetical protein
MTAHTQPPQAGRLVGPELVWSNGPELALDGIGYAHAKRR